MEDKRDSSPLTDLAGSPPDAGTESPGRVPLAREAILSHLAAGNIGSSLFVLDEIDSTNSFLQRLPEEDAVEGTVAVAEYQTAGRGRHGRVWVAPPRANLLFSVLLDQPDSPLGLVTLAGAVSVVEGLGNRGMKVGLKWPNDIVSNGRKLGGVLCETRSDIPSGSKLILGIGVNVNLRITDLPHELRETSTSTFELTRKALDRSELLGGILSRLQSHWEVLKKGKTAPLIRTAKEGCETLGHRVRVQQGEAVVEGLSVDLDDRGRLLLAMDNGKERVIEMGEITRLQ